MPEPKQTLREGKIIHYSVGVIVEQYGKFLLMDRATEPLGFAAVAGHVDEGESPEQAAARELHEEVGLVAGPLKLLYQEMLHWDWCRRGVTGHYWHLYSTDATGVPKGDGREVKSLGWYTREEMQHLRYNPAWTYWFKKMGITE